MSKAKSDTSDSSVNYGQLSHYFTGVAARRLSVVDIDGKRSNQHEFNGTKALRRIFGDDDQKNQNATFVYLCDDDTETLIEQGMLSWYDARKNHPTRTEYRLYYSDGEVIENAMPKDTLFVALIKDENPVVIITKADSMRESQLMWLFGIDYISDNDFALSDMKNVELSPYMLNLFEELGINLGIEPKTPVWAEPLIEKLLEKYPDGLPSCKEFSDFVISTMPDIEERIANPDRLLVDLYNQGTVLFKGYEKRHYDNVFKTIIDTYGVDSDKIMAASDSAAQARKSRAGKALENYAAYIMEQMGIRFSPQATTEKSEKPDFLFPSKEDYHNPKFSAKNLNLLAAKTTAKDRWRQVLNEGNRVSRKHLLTLDTGFSSDMLDNIKAHNLQIVLPTPYWGAYSKKDQKHFMSFAQFCELVLAIQNKIDAN